MQMSGARILEYSATGTISEKKNYKRKRKVAQSNQRHECTRSEKEQK